jgi:transposase
VTAKKPRHLSPEKITVIKKGKKVVQRNTRPKLLTEKQTMVLLEKALPGTFGIASDLSKKMGISKFTLYAWQKKYPAILERRQDARDVIVDVAENKLFKKVEQEEDWAIKYTLGNLGRSRGYADKQEIKHEHSGVIGTMNVSVVKVIKKEEDLD